MLQRGLLLAITLLVCCLCRLTKSSSYAPAHPQEKFCSSKYVFKFVPKAEMAESGRTKRYAGSYRMRNPMKVEVEQFFKGKEMAMSMMEMAPPDNNTLDDTFSEHKRRIEAAIIPTDVILKKNQAYIYFGRIMFRGDKKRKGRKIIMANLGNVIAEAEVSKVMRRGFRKKYFQGCHSGCRVATVFRKMEKEGNEKYCFFNYFGYTGEEKDCCTESQFCLKGKDGLCHWKKTKSYRKCKVDNAKAAREKKARRRQEP